jgi:fumarylacetoacetase
MLDFEAELGFVVGGPANVLGEPLAPAEAADRVFGVLLLNDWSARDVQSWESKPLGPLLGKAFATSVSAWVTPLAALEGARVPPPPRDPYPLPHLTGVDDRGLDLTLAVAVNGEVVARPPSAGLYWTPAQLLAHLASGGAVVRPGDLLGSGTLSGPEPGQRGSLLELTWHGREPLRPADGSELGYLRDGDEVVITAPGLAEVRGRVGAARP